MLTRRTTIAALAACLIAATAPAISADPHELQPVHPLTALKGFWRECKLARSHAELMADLRAVYGPLPWRFEGDRPEDAGYGATVWGMYERPRLVEEIYTGPLVGVVFTRPDGSTESRQINVTTIWYGTGLRPEPVRGIELIR